MADDRQRVLINALADQQGRGAAISALTGGRGGQQLQKGRSPLALTLELDQRQKEMDYRRERDDKMYDLRVAELGATLGRGSAKRLDKEVSDLSKGMEDLAPLEQAYSDVTSMMARYGGENIPGVGMFEGGSGTLGKTLRLMQGSEAQLNYSTVEGLLQSIRRNAIGSQQTRSELEKIEQRVGQSGWESEDVFRQAINQIGQALIEERNNIMARASDEGVVEYERRRGFSAPPAAGSTGKYKIISVE